MTETPTDVAAICEQARSAADAAVTEARTAAAAAETVARLAYSLTDQALQANQAPAVFPLIALAATAVAGGLTAYASTQAAAIRILRQVRQRKAAAFKDCAARFNASAASMRPRPRRS